GPGRAGDFQYSRVCRGRRPDELRRERYRCLSPCRLALRGAHSQGHEAGRLAGRDADQVRAGHQCRGRQGTRPRNPAQAARACRRGDRMKRREFITLLGGAGVAWPLAARAQPVSKLPTIGFLGSATSATQGQWVAAFVQHLRELGWIEGRTIAIEFRWAGGRTERYAEIAAEFVRLNVDIIVTVGTPAVVAAKQA